MTTPAPQKTPQELLMIIASKAVKTEQHLQSIRNMLTFFTIVLVLDIVFQTLGSLLSLR